MTAGSAVGAGFQLWTQPAAQQIAHAVQRLKSVLAGCIP